MFEVMYDEQYWTYDIDNVLQSVICVIDDKEVDMPVVWDKEGAYVEYNGNREYVLTFIDCDGRSMSKYNGDMLLINRLTEFFPVNSWQWNEGEVIELDDIACAIDNAQVEETQPYGDKWEHPCLENKSTEWHIGRILYFVKHPNEIRNIVVENRCDDNYIYPIPLIIDGNHRFMAAMWLNDQGKMDKVHCQYNGREDLLCYLTGVSDIRPVE